MTDFKAEYTPSGDVIGPSIRLYRCTMTICEPCIDGKGRECHTPGCILWLHTVSLPIDRNLMTQCKFAYEVKNG